VNDIDPMSANAYRLGFDAIDWAIQTAEIYITVAQEVTKGRKEDPNAFPVVFFGVDPRSTAMRIIGGLLDAGWTPPDLRQLMPAPEEDE